MISFDAAHAAVHYPPDRRHRIWVRPSLLVAAALIKELAIIEVAVILLTAQALVINRLAGLPYPLWRNRRPAATAS